MTLDTELDLRHAYESIAKMYQQCDGIAADATGDADTRADEIESVKMMIRKIEKQIAAYYAAHPERQCDALAPVPLSCRGGRWNSASAARNSSVSSKVKHGSVTLRPCKQPVTSKLLALSGCGVNRRKSSGRDPYMIIPAIRRLPKHYGGKPEWWPRSISAV